MEREKLKKINIRKVIVCVVMAIVVAIAGLVMYSGKVHKIGFIENVKQAIEEMINPNSEVATQADATIGVDVTDIINDDYVEHEHIWNEEYDETNHWRKCSICNKIEGMEEHTLNTIWALGYESCESNNLYKTTCNCGYGYTGSKPCVWNGAWDIPSTGYNVHVPKCAVCNSEIWTRPFIDNVHGGILVNDSFSEVENTGLIPESYRCKLADGSYRMCGSSEPCVICNGPIYKSDLHSYVAFGKDNTIKCQICGNVRRNL